METQIGTKNDSKHDQIAARAYQIWETSGRPAGSELRHWLQAEEELSQGSSEVEGRRPERKEHEHAKPATNKRSGARDTSHGAQERSVAA